MKSNKCQITLSVGFPPALISACTAKGSISISFSWESVSG